MMPKPDLGSVPFKEAIDHFKGKDLLTTSDWDELVRGEHANVFTIAGATKIEMLNDFKKSIDKIRATGGTIDDFTKDFRKIAQSYGWGYKGDESWRTKIIFETNMRTSNAAGRWAQIERRQAALKARDPEATLYLEYRVLDNAANRRPEHQSWDRIILPVDHPFWETHYAPNGFGCACSVRIRTQRYLDSKGLKPTKNPPDVVMVQKTNRQTGEIYPPTPQGIDVGFGHNHGRSGYLPTGSNIVDPRLGRRLADIAIESPDFEKFVQGSFEGDSLVGFMPGGLPDLIGSKSNRVMLNSNTVSQQLARAPEITIKDYAVLPQLFNDGLFVKVNDRIRVFFSNKNKIYQADIDIDSTGRKINTTSLKLAEQRDIDNSRREGEVLREPI